MRLPLPPLSRFRWPAGPMLLILLALMHARPSVAQSIETFMIMDLCTDPAGKVLTGVAPGMTACTHHRDIRPEEALTYHLHDFPNPRKGCKGRLGSLSKDNVPTVKGGVTRIISFYDRGVDQTCPGVTAEDPAFDQRDPGAAEGGSVQWFDADYGFIMGSWSPIAASYWRTPLCADWPDTSQRFFRGWVIGPAQLPAPGSPPGSGEFKTKSEHGDPERAATGCPARFTQQFTDWWRTPFAFQSGLTFDTLVSEHYSATNTEGDSPGAAEVVERTYWTAEFGLTRWEKWARDDWVHPRSGADARTLGEGLMASGTCSAPADLPEQVTPSWVSGSLTADGSHAERRRDLRSGETHLWYMTLCRDYSNVVPVSGPGSVPGWADAVPDIYWKE